MNVSVNKAPDSPLSLRFGVLYAPRVKTPPMEAFEAIEARPGVFVVRGYDDKGVAVPVFTGELLEAYRRFALHLRMDVDEPRQEAQPRGRRRA